MSTIVRQIKSRIYDLPVYQCSKHLILIVISNQLWMQATLAPVQCFYKKMTMVLSSLRYFSKKFIASQINYSTIEKECISLILAVQHFKVYLTSSSLPILVYSDHNPLTFINKMKNNNQGLMRWWCLMLQEYNIDIKHIKGKDNIIADALSRV